METRAPDTAETRAPDTAETRALDTAETRALDTTGPEEAPSLGLDELEPTTDASALSETANALEWRPRNGRPTVDAEEESPIAMPEESLITMPVVEADAGASEDMPDTRWQLEEKGEGGDGR
ncbi:MAG: hypothetical protein ACOC26_05540, partial [Halochromatium sp.]